MNEYKINKIDFDYNNPYQYFNTKQLFLNQYQSIKGSGISNDIKRPSINTEFHRRYISSISQKPYVEKEIKLYDSNNIDEYEIKNDDDIINDNTLFDNWLIDNDINKSNKQPFNWFKKKPKKTKKTITGGMANYNKDGKLVSQRLDNDEIKNYPLSYDNIKEFILDNNELTLKEKEDRLNTEYDELYSLSLIDKDNKEIKTILEKLDNEYYYNDELFDDRKERNEKIDKYINKITQYNKQQPIYESSDRKAEDEYENVFDEFIKNFDDIDFTDKTKTINLNYSNLKNKIGIENYNNIRNLFSGSVNTDVLINDMLNKLKKSGGKYYTEFGEDIHNMLRGDISEDIIKDNNILLSNYTDDYSEKYNSKDDNFYESGVIEIIKNDVGNILKEKFNIKNENEINKAINNIITSIKKYSPIDMRDKNHLYELKSRNIDVYDNDNKSYYNKTKLLDDIQKYIIPLYIDDKQINFIYSINPSKLENNKIKNMKIEYGLENKNNKSKNRTINLIPKNKNGYDIIWIDVNKNGTIFLNTSKNEPPLKKIYDKKQYEFNYKKGDISTPLQNKKYNLDENQWIDRKYKLKK